MHSAHKVCSNSEEKPFSHSILYETWDLVRFFFSLSNQMYITHISSALRSILLLLSEFQMKLQLRKKLDLRSHKSLAYYFSTLLNRIKSTFFAIYVNFPVSKAKRIRMILNDTLDGIILLVHSQIIGFAF